MVFTATIVTFIVCGLAALAGGFIDAISGGGGLLTIPALLLSGVPPHVALGTNKVSACMGTAVSLANYAKHGMVNWKMAAYGIPFSIIGSWLGSLLALYLHPDLLGKILVALLPVAMIGTLLPPKKKINIQTESNGLRFWLAVPFVCTSIGIYDGFFGPGTGTFLILLLHWVLLLDLLAASATAKAFNLASNISAAISFIWHDAVLWALGLTMACCFITGNWLGSSFAINHGAQSVRKFLIVSLVLLLSSLIWQYFIAPNL